MMMIDDKFPGASAVIGSDGRPGNESCEGSAAHPQVKLVSLLLRCDSDTTNTTTNGKFMSNIAKIALEVLTFE
jgi:hypothetical protein